jgi:enamine deaminase RidA (YjgF/YER057c/UK114 family)
VARTTPPGRYRSDNSWEEYAGYSRAARSGELIAVSGTTASGPDGRALCEGDTYGQTIAAVGLAINAVEQLGGSAQTVYRTRVLLAPEADWRDASRAHAELLGAVAPANSMYFVHALIGEGFLVEVEIEARVTR